MSCLGFISGGGDCRYRISLFNIVFDLSLKRTDDCIFCLSWQCDMSQAYWCPVIGKTFCGCLLKSNQRTANYGSASARVKFLLRTNAHHRSHVFVGPGRVRRWWCIGSGVPQSGWRVGGCCVQRAMTLSGQLPLPLRFQEFLPVRLGGMTLPWCSHLCQVCVE